MAKSLQRISARILRKDGESIKTIAKKLNVSSSTVSLWCRDIHLSDKQIQALEHRSHDPRYGRRLLNSQKQHEIRVEKTKRLYLEGVQEIGNLSERELFIAGIALYWAEGFKKDNLVGFSNSDPKMIILFIKWLKLCGIDRSRLKFRLGINESYEKRVDEIQIFWQTTLNIDPEQFQKPFLQRVAWQKKYDNPNEYHGVLRVRVSKSIDLLRKILGMIGGLGNN